MDNIQNTVSLHFIGFNYLKRILKFLLVSHQGLGMFSPMEITQPFTPPIKSKPFIHQAMSTTATNVPHIATPEIREALDHARLLTAEGKYSEAIALLTPFAGSGDRNVLFSLNYAHSQRRQDGDKAKSEEYLKAAAEHGHVKAAQMLARSKVSFWIGGKGHSADIRPLLVSAAKAFLPASLTDASEIEGCPNSVLTESLRIVLQKEAHRNPLAKVALGVICIHRPDAPADDLDYGVRLLESAVEDGRPEAIRYLGRAYAEGVLIPANAKRAFVIFGYGADMGCRESRHRLAECYLRGTGVAADIHQAVRLLKECTKQGHVYSPCVLGALYLEGTRVPQDIRLGRDLLRLSASRRCAVAAARLAEFLFWNPAYATIGYERQAYACIASELGDRSRADDLKDFPAAELPELLKSVALIKSITPAPAF